MKRLHLTLKKKWFDMIASGEKKEEYRDIKQHWINHLTWHEFHKWANDENSLRICMKVDEKSKYPTGVIRQDFDVIVFKNGYAKNAPSITLECLGITVGPAKPEWSDNWSGEVFIIKLGEIITVNK